MSVTISDRDFLKILDSVSERFHDVLLKKYRNQNKELLTPICTYAQIRHQEEISYHAQLRKEKSALNRKLHTVIHIVFLPKRVSGELFILPCVLDGIVYDKHRKNTIQSVKVSCSFNHEKRRAVVPANWIVEKGDVVIDSWEDYDRLVRMTAVYHAPDWIARIFIPV